MLEIRTIVRDSCSGIGYQSLKHIQWALSSEEFDALRRGRYARGEVIAGLLGADTLLTTRSSGKFDKDGEGGTEFESWLRIDVFDERLEI